MTVRELLSRMSSYEMMEWQEFAAIEPFGDYRADIRAGILASTAVNLHRPRNPLSPLDFVPDYWKRPETVEDQITRDLEVIRSATLAMGGRIVKRSEIKNG